MDYNHSEKSLRWLANQFQKIEEPKDDSDKIVNCIHLYCENGARAIADLIARAEEAEQRCKELEARCKRLDEARERANEATSKWEGMYRMALERAERAVQGKNKGNVMVCPVCQGRGSVHTGFYGNGNCSMDDVRNDKFPSVCHACRGKGILQVNEIKEE